MALQCGVDVEPQRQHDDFYAVGELLCQFGSNAVIVEEWGEPVGAQVVVLLAVEQLLGQAVDAGADHHEVQAADDDVGVPEPGFEVGHHDVGAPEHRGGAAVHGVGGFQVQRRREHADGGQVGVEGMYELVEGDPRHGSLPASLVASVPVRGMGTEITSK
ncbi:hypothetical protein QN239_33195 [Mycolicibacterium sp. Y3]